MRPDMKKALAEILEYAKVNRDFSDGLEWERWCKVVVIAFEALDKPTMADIEKILAESRMVPKASG